MKFLVVEATGDLGSAIVHAALTAGHDVSVLVSIDSPTRRKWPGTEGVSPKFVSASGGLGDQVGTVLAGETFDAVDWERDVVGCLESSIDRHGFVADGERYVEAFGIETGSQQHHGCFIHYQTQVVDFAERESLAQSKVGSSDASDSPIFG